MKHNVIICLFVVVFANIKVFATNENSDSLTCNCFKLTESVSSFGNKQDQQPNHSLSDTLAYTTALINTVNNTISKQNNSITWITVIIGIYGLVIAIVGFFSNRDLKEDMKAYMNRTDKTIGDNKNDLNDRIIDYEKGVNNRLKTYKDNIDANLRVIDVNFKELKNDFNRNKAIIDNNIKEYAKNSDNRFKFFKQEVNDNNKEYKESITKAICNMQGDLMKKIEEINAIKSSIDSEKKRIESILDGQNYYNKYLQKVNQYIFYASLIVDNDLNKQETVENIRKKAHRYYHIMVLFLPWSKDTFPAFTYIQANGIEEDVKDLQFIADNDPDERKKEMALKAIGSIKGRSLR